MSHVLTFLNQSSTTNGHCHPCLFLALLAFVFTGTSCSKKIKKSCMCSVGEIGASYQALRRRNWTNFPLESLYCNFSEWLLKMQHLEVKQRAAIYTYDTLRRQMPHFKMSCLNCFYLQLLLLVSFDNFYRSILILLSLCCCFSSLLCKSRHKFALPLGIICTAKIFCQINKEK